MKMMKKITAILLALFMLPYTALASKTEEKPAQNSGVYELLVSLGIVEDTFGFKYDKGITRMEFARVVVKAGGFDSQDVAPVGLFSDVPADNEYAKDIEFLASINVVSGGSDGNFYPNRMVKLEEAVAMLLRIAGYDDLVSMEQKSYPDNYMTVAKRFDLLDKVTIGTDVISGDNMLMLVYNMLSLNTFGFDKTTTVKLDKADTILSKVHNVYYRRGIVTSNSVTALNSRSEVSKAGITLETDDEIVEIAAGNTDIESMIGRNVTVYYRYDEKEDVSECLYYERTKKNEETVINLDFIGELNNSLIEYTIEDSGKEKKIKLDSPSIIYNQGYYSGSLLDENSFGGMTGTITAIDNDADGYYDVLVIEAYNTYVVKNAVSPQKTFYDKQTNAEVKIDPDDFDKFEMKYSDGGEAVFDDLVAGTVVSVAKTSPTSQAKAACVILSNKKISGMVTDAYDDGINSYVELDGTDIYKVLSVAGNVVKGTDGVTLYLDAFDNVVYVEAKYLANYQYGLIIKKYFNEFDDAISVKLLTREGKIETVAFAQRTVVDGSTCKSANLINNALNAVGEIAIDGTDLPSGVFPVRYKLNDNMEIYALDTPKRGDFEDEYSMTLMSQGRHVYSSDGVLGFRVPLNSGTTVLRVDTDTGFDNFSYYLEESRYAFVGNNSFASGTAYQYSAYSIDPNSPYADFVLTFSSPWTNYDTFVCVVDKITQTYDEVTGEVLYRLTGMVRGTEVKVSISKEYEQTFLDMKLVRGDVIRYATNLVGHICMIDDDRAIVKYDKDTGTMKFNNVREGKTSISNFDSANYSTVAMMGEVRSREEGLIQYHYIEWETSFDIDRPYAEATESTLMCAPIGGGVPVTVYDAKDDRIYAGTYDDIVAIDSNFSEHSKVLLRYRSSRLQEVVVFNDRSLGK